MVSIFNELQNTSSKLGKAAILKNNIGNERFKSTLRWLLNPFVLTGISAKRLSKTIVKSSSIELASWEEVMAFFETHTSVRDEDVKAIQNFIGNQDEDYQNLYRKLVTKTLKLGMDAKTVNSVYGKGFIPVFEVQLGTPLKNRKIKPNTWFSLSRKLNGTRCLYYKGEMYARSGKKYCGLDHIIESIKKLVADGIVLDGELLYKNYEHLSDSEAFQKGAGIANSKAESKPELKLCVFDIITVEDFDNGKSSATYRERKKKLLELKDKLSDDNIEVVSFLYEGTD
ncbi:MAG: hypothetical protein Q4F95_02280 [Oscillospiraceae bacterium]|nr:hypothetical protein [Oscillospiraceae bacterium]